MSDSIWKKEISFKKKGKAEADPDAFELPSQSFLKKEIKLSRKSKAPQEPKAEQEEQPEKKQSVLKKEISFSRKAKAPKAPKEPKAAKESIWKQDVSLGKKKEREIERLSAEAAHAVEPVPFPVEPVAAPQPTELAEAFVAAMPEPEPALPEPVTLAVVPEPVDFPSAVEFPHAVELPPPTVELASPAVELPPDLHPVESLPVDEAPEPVAVEQAPPDQAPPLAPIVLESVAETWPEPVPEPAVEVPEPWLDEAELPPEPVVAAPVTLHPPVPAAELPPLPDASVKTPFWKKELSVSRKPKAAKVPKGEKPARAPKEKGTPFWKKELGRKSKAPVADAATEQLPVARQPLHKRQLSLPALSLPKLPSRGSAKGAHSAKKLVGLKIGASQLAAARISNNGVAELQQTAREPLAAGVVVAGELRDPEALGAALKVFFAKHKLPKKGVRLGIASNRIGVRILEIVGVEEEKQLANAVQFRAQEALPIPLDEAVLDYRVLDESVDAEGQTVKRVLLVVAYRELIDRYVSACRKAGINLAGIDLEAFALLRALGAPADRDGSALVAVAIGHDRSTFAVSDGRICEFTRVVEWGGSALNVALARAFDSTPSEVETLKRSLSLDGSTNPEDLTPEQVAAALDAVRRQVQSFARELVSSLQFYQNQPGSLGIGEIVITGGTAQLPGLAEELERLIGVHVRIGDPFARLKVAKRFAGTEQLGSLAVAIGLGIED
ncbi:MAG TPA: type IV pilus assembly protein PilM [Gaiellaceae bacterium]|jgi:type IV pilus assembly protein PilM